MKEGPIVVVEGGYGVSIGRFDAGSSEVEAGDAVADALQGAPQPVPAPRTVAGPVDEDKVRHLTLITSGCGRLFCHLFCFDHLFAIIIPNSNGHNNNTSSLFLNK